MPMDFAFTEDQTLLRDSARRFVEQEYGFAQRRAVVDRHAGFDARHWSTFAAMGWLGAALPEDVGGFGGGPVATAIVAEQLGRGLVVEPYVAVAVHAACLLQQAGEPARALLGALIDGRARVVVALDAAHGPVVAHGALAAHGSLVGHGPPIANGASVARGVGEQPPGAGDRQAVLVAGGPHASHFLAPMLDTDRRIAWWLLEADAPGLVRHDYRLIDGSAACDLAVGAVALQAGTRLHVAGGAEEALDLALAHARVALCAEAVGVMDRALWTTRDHLLQRRQFGAPLASFQALQHRLADMLIAHEQARAALHGALAALDGDDAAARRRAVAIAKVQAGRSGRFIGAQAIQLHGAMGMTDECIVGHCFKRLMVLDSLLGPASHHLKELAGPLRDPDDEEASCTTR
jgi:alkylation response protein AidB-like acyl-CoA dehydrogenase